MTTNNRVNAILVRDSGPPTFTSSLGTKRLKFGSAMSLSGSENVSYRPAFSATDNHQIYHYPSMTGAIPPSVKPWDNAPRGMLFVSEANYAVKEDSDIRRIRGMKNPAPELRWDNNWMYS